ncbi:BrxA/BrxB family bacilliredoxin [Paraliobacillus salinarum]|uniref:BrxA/BrxB family bacilliredoxin n=1 Tax=Paraliobacillus salinarum TaxID=1158996 RepID=UPI0015F558CC|nr:BrxA/BrxB family bacilliredoxin [Paraliobacillus salinarum]
MNEFQLYMQEMSQPMRDELTNAGFKELTTPEEVEGFMSNLEGTSLVVVNSVCGCAGGLARPAVLAALEEVKPDHLVTVFAGQDREATEKMREYFVGIEPSSPSIAILSGNQVAHFIPRDDIEGNEVEPIKENIIKGIQTI